MQNLTPAQRFAAAHHARRTALEAELVAALAARRTRTQALCTEVK